MRIVYINLHVSYDFLRCNDLSPNSSTFVSVIAASQSLFFSACSNSSLSLLLSVEGSLEVEVDADAARVGLHTEGNVVWGFCLVRFVGLLGTLKLTVCRVRF